MPCRHSACLPVCLFAPKLLAACALTGLQLHTCVLTSAVLQHCAGKDPCDTHSSDMHGYVNVRGPGVEGLGFGSRLVLYSLRQYCPLCDRRYVGWHPASVISVRGGCGITTRLPVLDHKPLAWLVVSHSYVHTPCLLLPAAQAQAIFPLDVVVVGCTRLWQ
jgi:hypothetical protein